jgi:hypothetical protein
MVDYHWSPANQRGFLEKLAECGNIAEAAKSVSMSAQGAYNFAARAAGRVFALGWDAAVLIARRRVEGELMDRALMGQEETYERDPETGKVKRTRIYNGTTMAMLARLDKMVAGKADCPADAAMARIVAQDFERFLDLVEAGGSGAEAMLFLKARDGGLVPMAHIPQAAEALEFAKQHQLSQKSVGADAADEEPMAELTPEDKAARMSVWFCQYANGWRTNFPPPADFIGEEQGEFGDDGYERELNDEEEHHVSAQLEAEIAPVRLAGEAARRAFFGIVETKGLALENSDCDGVVHEVGAGSVPLGTVPEVGAEAHEELSPHGDCPQMVGEEGVRSVPLGTVPEGTVLDAAPKPDVVTHRPIYMNPPSRYVAAGQIPPWAERIG